MPKTRNGKAFFPSSPRLHSTPRRSHPAALAAAHSLTPPWPNHATLLPCACARGEAGKKEGNGERVVAKNKRGAVRTYQKQRRRSEWTSHVPPGPNARCSRARAPASFQLGERRARLVRSLPHGHHRTTTPASNAASSAVKVWIRRALPQVFPQNLSFETFHR